MTDCTAVTAVLVLALSRISYSSSYVFLHFDIATASSSTASFYLLPQAVSQIQDDSSWVIVSFAASGGFM